MARLSADPDRALRAANRSCGTCSACCSVLRVDELAKPAGSACPHQRAEGGCGIYSERPEICRAYQCLWLQGGLEDDERPDQTGGIVDLEAVGAGVRLRIQENRAGAFDASPALRAIAERYRSSMPVRIGEIEDVMNPDRPFRVLLADGVEQRIEGEWVETRNADGTLDRKRMGWAERLGRRVQIAWRRHRIARSLR